MKNMSTNKLNTLPVPTFRWLGVNFAECDISGYETKETEIYAAEGEEKTEILFIEGEGVTNVNINVENGSSVKLVQVFDVEGTAVSDVTAKVGENADFELVQLYLGGDIVSEITTDLDGRKARFGADIGYLLDNSDRLDINLTANHHGRKTVSEINAKGVLNGESSKVFKGTIDFKNGAVASVGSEKEEVLLMSETAGCFHINFTQTIDSDRYYLAFAAILEELGIPCEKLPFESYLNPVVELPQEQR